MYNQTCELAVRIRVTIAIMETYCIWEVTDVTMNNTEIETHLEGIWELGFSVSSDTCSGQICPLDMNLYQSGAQPVGWVVRICIGTTITG